MNSYLVPIRKDGTSYAINWLLVDEVIDFVKTDIMSYCLSDHTLKQNVVKKYDLSLHDGDSYFMRKADSKEVIQSRNLDCMR